MHLSGCIPMKMFLVRYEEILNDVTYFPKSFETTNGSLKSASGSRCDLRVSGSPSLFHTFKTAKYVFDSTNQIISGSTSALLVFLMGTIGFSRLQCFRVSIGWCKIG